MERSQVILIFAKAIEATFSLSDWTEIGYRLTEASQYIDQHPRLLRSMHWGDSDYRGHVQNFVDHILQADVKSLKQLVEYEPITIWLATHDPRALQSLQAELCGLTISEVILTGSKVAFLALADAQVLLESQGGPISAVDRVHTGLHAFLKGACSDAGITFTPDATANKLLKHLLEAHPSLQDLGPRRHEVRRLVLTSAATVDAIGTLRNNASLAHPNEELLGHDEALLAVNLVRSLLRFLDAKIKADEQDPTPNPAT